MGFVLTFQCQFKKCQWIGSAKPEQIHRLTFLAAGSRSSGVSISFKCPSLSSSVKRLSAFLGLGLNEVLNLRTQKLKYPRSIQMQCCYFKSTKRNQTVERLDSSSRGADNPKPVTSVAAWTCRCYGRPAVTYMDLMALRSKKYRFFDILVLILKLYHPLPMGMWHI